MELGRVVGRDTTRCVCVCAPRERQEPLQGTERMDKGQFDAGYIMFCDWLGYTRVDCFVITRSTRGPRMVLK